LPEIIETFDERHGQARARMQPDLQAQSLSSRACVEPGDLRSHVERRLQCVERIDEAGHDRVADRLDECTRVAQAAFPQIAEVLSHQIERFQVADPVVERPVKATTGPGNGSDARQGIR